MSEYTQLTENERRRVERLRESGKSARSIAKILRRGKSTIAEELTRNKTKNGYSALRAQHKAKQRRKLSKLQCLKVAMDPTLKAYVTKEIENDQSPEAIAGRLRYVEKQRLYASTKAIYKFVRSPHGRRIEKHLYRKAVKRRGGPKRGEKKTSVDGRIMIDKRPKNVEKRKDFGHFEGDFIESGKDGKGSLLVLVERKTRYPFLVYTEDKSTAHINRIIAETLRDVPVASITLDNDLSFQKHAELSELIEATVFFCHPYCSHEKGTVENRNRAVRRYVPKKTDLSSVFIERFKEIESILRTRYMKCLNFKTPAEAWDGEIERAYQSSTRGIIHPLKNTRHGCEII